MLTPAFVHRAPTLFPLSFLSHSTLIPLPFPSHPPLILPRAVVQPLLYAAVGADIESNDFCGPSGIFAMNGPAVKEVPAKAAMAVAEAEKLWAESVKVTGLDYLN